MDSFVRFVEVDAAFDAALGLPPDERTGHLSSLRSLDPWIAGRVEALLAAAASSDEFMRAGGAFAGAFGDALSNALGTGELEPMKSVGSYRIEREIGRGGMSIVYLATRASSDFDHTVAIKVLKRGLDTDDILRRFSQERRILASFDHPAIARLFDGGATEDGRPYIVMEYVQGTSIDRYCTERRLARAERLRLFLDVARAVEYAHRNLIVHRDLKPGNVLVSDEGRVKLLDFGIAKLLDDPALGAPTLHTERPMTPEYASPEQRRGEPITTASDVYQLGLLLYEMLVGHRAPLTTAGDLHAASVVPMVATRKSPNGVAIDADLEGVILMALQQDPECRYASVSQFAEDVERFLSGAPVRARPATMPYRLRKFVARHPAGVTAAIAFLLATSGYASVLTVQARALADARDTARASANSARQVAEFMVDVFTLANPTEGEGVTVTARQLLDRGASRLETGLQHQPSVQAELLRAAGKSYFGLGLNGEAEGLLRRSVELLRPVPVSEGALAVSLNELGLLQLEGGHAAEARTLLTESLTLRRAVHGTEHPEVAESLHGLARVEAAAGNHAAAERLFKDALALRERLLGNESLETARTRHGLGVTLQAAGRLGEAEPLVRSALRTREAALGEGHPDTTDSMNALGLLLRERGNAAQAEPLLKRALDANRKRLGIRHPYVAVNLNNLALVQRDLAQPDLAAPLYREALDILGAAYGREHPRVAVALFNLAMVLQDVQEYAEAETLLRDALAIDRKTLGDEHVEIAVDRTHLGYLLYLKGETTAAEQLLRPALARLRQALPNHPRLARAALGLGELLSDGGRAYEAEPLLREAVAIYSETYGPDDPRTLAAALTLGRATSKIGRFAEMSAVVAARCRPTAGRYRVEVGRALDKLLRAFIDGKNAALTAEVASRDFCERSARTAQP